MIIYLFLLLTSNAVWISANTHFIFKIKYIALNIWFICIYIYNTYCLLLSNYIIVYNVIHLIMSTPTLNIYFCLLILFYILLYIISLEKIVKVCRGFKKYINLCIFLFLIELNKRVFILTSYIVYIYIIYILVKVIYLGVFFYDKHPLFYIISVMEYEMLYSFMREMLSYYTLEMDSNSSSLVNRMSISFITDIPDNISNQPPNNPNPNENNVIIPPTNNDNEDSSNSLVRIPDYSNWTFEIKAKPVQSTFTIKDENGIILRNHIFAVLPVNHLYICLLEPHINGVNEHTELYKNGINTFYKNTISACLDDNNNILMNIKGESSFSILFSKGEDDKLFIMSNPKSELASLLDKLKEYKYPISEYSQYHRELVLCRDNSTSVSMTKKLSIKISDLEKNKSMFFDYRDQFREAFSKISENQDIKHKLNSFLTD